jgi:cytochrome c oxidase cbb3-type subunit 3
MSSFWSLWIIVLTVISLIGITWLLFANRKTKGGGRDATTGHVYDGIEEYDNPMPAWWFHMFVITIVFGVGYLIAYPGMGEFKGLLNWTQVNQWQAEMDSADKKYGALFAEYGAMPVEQLASNSQALKMGQRMFANNCAQCHGSDARGSRGFPNLADAEWLYGGSPEQIKTSITEGRTGAMPAWGPALGAEGVTSVTRYVMSLSGREIDPATAEEGKAKFGMFCASCHGAEGKGNVAMGAPDLSNAIWLYGGSEGAIQQSVSNGRNGVMPAHKELLSEDKIHLLTAYIYSLSLHDQQ